MSSSKSSDSNTPKKPTKQYPFIFGGLGSASAAVCTHPLDFFKVRLQTAKQKQGLLNTAKLIVKEEGALAFYNGLSASLLRQLTYSSTRLGAYEVLSPIIRDEIYDGKPLPFIGKIGLSCTSGVVGGLVGTPADVVNIRMQANVGGKDASANYKHALDGLVRIGREEGVLKLWRGVAPNLVRGALMTAGQVATYDQVKEVAVDTFHMPDDLNTQFWPSLGTHFACSNVAGLVATIICSPVDVVKTRVMNAKEGEFRSAVHCFSSILRNEGPAAFFKGFVPSWSRLGPHTVLTFVFLEQFKGIYDEYFRK